MNNYEWDLVLMSLVIFVPSLFAIVLLFVPPGKNEWMRWIALSGTAATLVLSLMMFNDYYRFVADFYLDTPSNSLLSKRAEVADVARSNAQAQGLSDHDWVGRRQWIARFGIDYYLGVDGISMPLVLLTTVLSFLGMIASWNIERMVRGYCILFLILETGMVGTFLALDFFLFYIFWEIMLLPMYFLIGVWGGPRREYAAIKFFLYTLLGSVFILIALLGFYFTDVRDFDVRAAANEPKNSFDLVVLQRAGSAAAAVLDYQAKAPKLAEDLLLEQEKVKLPTADQQEVKKDSPAGRTILQRLREQVTPQVPEKTAGLVEQNRHQVAEKVVGDLEKSSLSPTERKRLESGDAAAVQQLNDRVARRVKDAESRLKEQSFFSSTAFQITMFLLLFVGFAIKVPLFPFHTWLPDAHVEAPTPISMILAGVLLKMGGYGILRIAYPICPWAAETLAWWVSLFGIINIVYGAFAAMAQTDFKKLVAYSSISHMGYVILGIAVWSAADKSQYWSWGMNGAMFQMIAHGITSAGMFFLVGVIYDRAHHRNLDNFRGLYEPMPLYGGISALIFFAAMGLPGMCGFVGEFMVILATWNYSRVFSILAALTVVITAAYILWTLQRVFLGQNPAYKGYADINLRELLCIVPLAVLAVILGVWPNMLLSWMEPSVTGLVESLARVALLQ